MRRIIALLVAIVFVVIAAANLEALPDYAATWPEPFQRTFLNIFLWQWCLLGALSVICFVAGILGRFGAKRLTYFRDRHVPQPMTEPTRIGVSRAAGFLVGTLLASSLLPSLRLEEPIRHVSGHAVVPFGDRVEVLVNTLVVIAITMFVYSYWDAICELIADRAVGHHRAERLLVPMMRKFIRAIIVICGGLVALASIFGTQTLTGLVAGLGVTGLVVALAGKDSVENVFGSLTILFDMPFALGDYVRIDKVEGNVEEINLRSTRIRTVEDTLITLPNANLIRASVENFGARRTRRQRLVMRLNYESDPAGVERFCAAIKEFIDQNEDVDSEKTLVQLDDPAETSIGVVAIWYLHASSALEEAASRSRILEVVLNQKRSQGLLLASLPAEPPKKA